MKLNKTALSRRTILKGSGAAIALPLLDAMIPGIGIPGVGSQRASASGPAAASINRLGYVYIPMGFNPAEWTPGEVGDLPEELPSSLQPLSSVRDQLTVLSNMDLQNAYPGSHATSNSAFLSAARAKLTESTDYYLGTTVDQIAARQIGSKSALPSLELAMDSANTVGQCDNGYACALPKQSFLVITDNAFAIGVAPTPSV